MADINYTVNQDIPENIEGFEQYSQEDRNLISSFQINSTFDPEKNYSELHILSLSDELLESDYLYNRHRQLGNAQSAGQDGASVLTIDPIADSKYYGYEGAGIKLLYHFLDDLYTDDITTREFFIQEISPDRTEVVLNSLNITQEQVISYTANIKNKLDTQSYFAGFRLNFKENDLIIATNIDTIDSGTETLIAVKLYEPLPDTYDLKSTLTVVEIISDSIAYEVDSEYITQPEQLPTLKPANFNIEIADESVVPTAYLNYNELFSYPVTNANNQVYSLINEKGIDINVDYTNFNDFIHFSSAQERLINFKYKLELIDGYYTEINNNSTASIGLVAVAGSNKKCEELITGIVNNFDHYERFLYYESGSSSWPKSNDTKPYINQVGTTEVDNWYSAQALAAASYDESNSNSLLYSIPAYLRDDANNENYLTFVYMVGQHFDNLWLYSKAVTDKYDADNRPDKGISKDLVGEALKNFGVKLYTSNKSIEDLFTTFTGQAYQSGSEVINYYITGSLTGSNTPIQPTSYDSYQKEIQKRIYHNLPFLLKTKGTERGLRALINCFGISSDILKIKQYGGVNAATLPFLGDQQYFTSSLDKIRLDNTGTIAEGSTLSNSVSILRNNSEYTTDLHAIEVGFSPSDNIDNYLKAINSGTCTRYTMTVNTPSQDTFSYTDCITGQLVQQTCDITRTFFAVTDTVSYDQNASQYFLSPENINTVSDIDQYLGDPNNLNLDNYSGLSTLLEELLKDLTRYNLQDYVRLIKFFDNTIFKMVKDFIPARSVATTGIVIKPNLLNISKAKSVSVSVTQPEYSGSIDTAFVTGSDGGAFSTTLPRTYEYTYHDDSCTQYTVDILVVDENQSYTYLDCTTGAQVAYPYDVSRTFYAKLGSVQFDDTLATVSEQDIPQVRSYTVKGNSQLLNTSYKDTVQTPQGLGIKQLNWQTDQPLYTGELSGSVLQVSNGEWNIDNPYKQISNIFTPTVLRAISKFPGDICGILPKTPFIVTTNPYNIVLSYNIPGNDGVTYYIKSGSESAVDITSTASSYNFTKNYTAYTVSASKLTPTDCTGSAIFNTEFCNMTTTPANIPVAIEGGRRVNITPWFSVGLNTSSSYSASYTNIVGTSGIADPYHYYPASSSIYRTATITLQDNKITTCNTDTQIEVYPTMSVVEIGTQDWALKNLNVEKYTDGTPIPQVTEIAQWQISDKAAWCYHINDPDNGATYGKLYNNYAVAGITEPAALTNPALRKKLYPSDWKAATTADFTTLRNFVGGSSLTAVKLREAGTTHWQSSTYPGNNSSGFTGLPGGFRDDLGSFVGNVYSSIGKGAYWWSNSEDTEYNPEQQTFMSVLYDNSTTYISGISNPRYGLSVRLTRPVTRVILGTNKTSTSSGNNSEMVTLYNLDTARYRNGDPIPQASSSAQFEAYGVAGIGAWSYYNFDPANNAAYGKYYNWYAVTDTRKITENSDYTIPTKIEWDFIGNTSLGGASTAGKAMKATAPVWNGTNTSGFTGIPTGYLRDTGFQEFGTNGWWWSSTELNSTVAYPLYIANSTDSMTTSISISKKWGIPVRLIKNKALWQTG